MNPTLELNFWTRLLGILALEITFVIAFAFAAQTFIRSAFWRRAVWQITFVCLLFVAGAELTGLGRGISGWLTGKPVPERKVSVRLIPMNEQFLLPTMETEMIEPVFIPQKETPVMRSVWWPGIVWLAGFVLIVVRIFCARIFLTLLRWRKRKITDAVLLQRVAELAPRLRFHRKIHLLETSGLSSPMTFGMAWPSIGLPFGFAEKFTPTQQDAILTHELAHLAARDPFWYLLADCATALWWWQPLVWLARRRLHSASEHAADEAALILENGPGTLAECLVNLGQQMTRTKSFGWLGVDGSGFRSQLGKRVERLLDLKESRQPSRSWKILFAKTSVTILAATLVIFTSGWMQNKDVPRAKNWKVALKQSWNDSFASLAMIALAEKQTEPVPKPIAPIPENKTPPSYEEVSFDAVFYDDVSAEQFENISQITASVEDKQAVLILSSNELRGALLSLSKVSSTYDMVGRKFSGGRFVYRGTRTNGNECCYLTEMENGINRVKGAEMTYATTNLWNFSFVPQKLATSTWINLEWPNEERILTTGFEVPNDGGVMVRRVIPGDPGRCQLILFSSAHVYGTTTNDAETVWSDSAEVSSLISVGKRLFETSKLDEAQIKLDEALRLDPKNKPALYYLSLIEESKSRRRNQSESPKLIRPTIPSTTLDKTMVAVPKASNNSVVRSNVVYISNGRKGIKAKLDRIRLSEVLFENILLGEVLKTVRTESKNRDPDHVGINFVFNPNAASPAFATNDPAATVFTPAPSTPVNLDEIKIQISPPPHDMRLVDVLDAIVQGANKPIQYSIEDYAVVFSPKNEGLLLLSRTFKVAPDAFDYLNKDDGQSASSSNGNRTNLQAKLNQKIRDYFTAAGVDFGDRRPGPVQGSKANGKSIFFNDRTGILLVRVTQEDLEVIASAIERLNKEPSSEKAGKSGDEKKESVTHSTKEIPLLTRSYKVNPKTFPKQVQQMFVENFGNAPETNSLIQLLRDYFTAAGADFTTNAPTPTSKSLYYNATKGMLLVRASATDLEIITNALELLNQYREFPPIQLEATFIEVEQSAMKRLGMDWFARRSISSLKNQSASDVVLKGTNITKANVDAVKNLKGSLPASGMVFSQSAYQSILKTLKKTKGVNVLASPEMTTLTGRETEMAVLDVQTIVNGPGLNPVADTNVYFTNGFRAENIFTGSLLNVLPEISADVFSIQLSLRTVQSEFLGYYDSAHGRLVKNPFADHFFYDPQMRARNLTGKLNIWDGQTVMLAQEDKNETGSKRKTLLLFVTGNLVDSDGKKVHSEKEMFFTTNTIPPQPRDN